MTRALGYVRLSQDGKSLDRQEQDVRDYADEHDLNLAADDLLNEGEHETAFDEDREKYQELLQRVDEDDVTAVIVPNLSRLSRERKTRMRLLLNFDEQDVTLHAVEMGRGIDLGDEWELVEQCVRATMDDLAKRKEIERSKRATQERLEKGYDHGRAPYGLRYDDDGQYWIADRESGEFVDAIRCIRLRDEGNSWREIADKTGVHRSTARRIYEKRGRYLAEVAVKEAP